MASALFCYVINGEIRQQLSKKTDQHVVRFHSLLSFYDVRCL
ncbi:hypothetical protein HMPREF9510_02539 [Enterococcus faecalis TX0470]|nr:hypothetical protein HMPREF9510_02539 [Enterococcus faecalis TX0470]